LLKFRFTIILADSLAGRRTFWFLPVQAYRE
jgi:hypothetical protein